MKTKNIIWTLVATNTVAVLVILIVLVALKKPQDQTTEPAPVTYTEAPIPSTQPEAAEPPSQPETDPESNAALLILKDVLEATDSLYERTLLAYKTKINQEPPYWGKYIAGYADAKEGRYPEAIERLQRRLQTSPNDLENLYTLAWTYAKKGDLTQAEQISSQCLQIAPKFSRAALLKACVKLQQNDAAAAMAVCQQAMGDNPEAAGPHYGMGRLYALDGEYDQAIASYTEAARLKPDAAELYLHLGLVYERADQITKAQEAFRKAIELNENYAEAYLLMGVSLDKAGRHEEAATAYQKAMVHQTDFPEAQLFMGIQSLRLKDDQTATRYFTQAISMQPDYPEAHLGLGLAYMVSSQFEKAKKEWELLANLNPEMAAKLNALIQTYSSGKQ